MHVCKDYHPICYICKKTVIGTREWRTLLNLPYLIWLSLLADLLSVSRTKELSTTNYCGLINDVSNTYVDAHFKTGDGLL